MITKCSILQDRGRDLLQRQWNDPVSWVGALLMSDVGASNAWPSLGDNPSELQLTPASRHGLSSAGGCHLSRREVSEEAGKALIYGFAITSGVALHRRWAKSYTALVGDCWIGHTANSL